MKRILGAIAFAALVMLAPAPAQSGDGKVTICHYPPGNPDNAHTITISESALQTHLDQHGDTLGACGSDPG